MRWYRGKYDTSDQSYKIGAHLKVVGEQLRTIVGRNKQGDAVAYAGKFSTTEAVRRGTVVIAQDSTGIRTPYKVGPITTGMGGISVCMLEEDGMI